MKINGNSIKVLQQKFKLLKKRKKITGEKIEGVVDSKQFKNKMKKKKNNKTETCFNKV